MPEWLAVLVAGAMGGIASEYLSEGGFAGPARFTDAQGRRRLDPGTLGALVVGALTGIAFWGLYNPAASFADADIEVRPVIGALLVGVGGGRVLAGFVEGYIAGRELQTSKDVLDQGLIDAGPSDDDAGRG